MGNCLTQEVEVEKVRTSTNHQRQSNLQLAADLMMRTGNDGGDMSQRKYDDVEVAKLKKELLETPQIFVLNNLLMSVMFFENYEREKQRLQHSSRTTLERELNPTLLRDQTIECVIPDVIFEKVNKNVRFQSVHGIHKNKIEPLVPKRIYVVNDNIEVLESKHTPQYSAIDKPSYQVCVQNLEDHQGFVKLKCEPSQPRRISPLDQEPEKFEPKPGPSTEPEDEIYDYTTIASVNTPKPLNITSYERRDTLPKTCFTSRKIKKYDEKSNDSEEEDYEEMEEPPVKQELFETITYISSSGFMKYFQNAVFPNSLGQALGFDTSEINLAKAIPGKIFCNLQDVDEDLSLLPCEIIPCIAIQWPIELTFEFHDRAERPTMWGKFQEEYRWPKANMINDIRTLNCVLIPRGYIPKRGDNIDSEIEWEVGFPKAQRYLDTHMTHTQMRAFLFILTLYKSHIEPAVKKYDGLLVDHIRTHMYWECESNPRDWPEHRLGTKLMLILKNLMQKLATGKMSDFFIKRKNMFLNVPNKHLTHAQKVFHNVLESPAIYFIDALRNLKYRNHRFYPQLNLKELYSILVATTPQLVNPRILEMRPPNMVPKNRRPAVDGDTNYKKEIRWKERQEKINREKFLQKRKEEQRRLEENLNVQRRESVNSINLDWQPENKFDMFKTRALLMFFIMHFVEMAKKSRRLATQRQALFFLKQANYLTRILEDFGLEADARELYESIRKEEDTSKKLSVTESFEIPPSTPKRNSAQINWDLTQQVKSNNINLNKLNNSYNNTAVQNNFSKIKKHPSTLKKQSSILRISNSQNEDRRKSGDRRSIGFSDTVELR